MPNKRDDFNVTSLVLLKKKDFVVPPTTGLIEFDDSVKFNGQFNIDSNPGDGTKLTLVVPFKEDKK